MALLSRAQIYYYFFYLHNIRSSYSSSGEHINSVHITAVQLQFSLPTDRILRAGGLGVTQRSRIGHLALCWCVTRRGNVRHMTRGCASPDAGKCVT